MSAKPISVKPIVNPADRVIAAWYGRPYKPKRAKITCRCGKTWIGRYRQYYTCPKCGCRFRLNPDGSVKVIREAET
jgi:hypothetical protein